MASFKVPTTIPQDLLLISDIIGVPSISPSPQPPHDDIDSSDSEAENASEDEIEAVLLPSNQDNIVKQEVSEPFMFLNLRIQTLKENILVSGKTAQNEDLDDDEDPVPSSGPATYLHTKNEVVDEKITVPEVERGIQSQVANRGLDRALDSDTLLVFDDRKVMGYIYETFGPTSQPLYQVRFNDKFPLNPEIVKISRPVFHVPARSHFVFLSQLKVQKGSDASNVHDEEPAEDELEFSDDEAEAAHRSRLKRKRAGSRARSVTSSRHGTPSPSQMRDQDLVDDAYLHGNAYDARGPYDFDSNTPGPSRPPPIPYDDPYSETYHAPSAPQEYRQAEQHVEPLTFSGPMQNVGEFNRGDGREWRGRGRGRARGDHRRHARGDGVPRRGRTSFRNSSEAYDTRRSQSLSPTSAVIARATGQLPDHSGFMSQVISSEGRPADWGYIPSTTQQQQQPFRFGGQGYHQQQFLQMPFVQPHINPRFASSFGMGANTWNDNWAVPVEAHSENAPGEETKRTD
ncbi:Gar1/Naf1 RNA binding region-domain-containing protein [Cyathus striatus]|nr:Gar1/Naf1 RNA binding region-domain-containing protein [Cyathus striatus]